MNADDPAVLLRRRVDRIACLIVATDYPEIDIYIEADQLRGWCAAALPDKLALFDMIYGSRLLRLWTQFRGEPGPLRGILRWS